MKEGEEKKGGRGPGRATGKQMESGRVGERVGEKEGESGRGKKERGMEWGREKEN